MQPLFEGDPIEKSLKTIRENLGEARGNLYALEGDKPYTETLEFAVRVKNSEVRDKLVKAAQDLRIERQRKSEAYKQLDVVCKQIESLLSKD